MARRQRRLERGGGSLLGEFRAIMGLLGEWGYVDGWSLTEAGARLRSVYNERDLLLAEAVGEGLFDDLRPPALAALASTFVFDPRQDVIAGRWPSRELAARWERLETLASQLARAEAERDLPETPPPEPGFAETAFYWASGIDLDDLLGEDDMAAGDFVRTCRQLIDLLIQLRDGFAGLAGPAQEAVTAINRGVVAAGGVR